MTVESLSEIDIALNEAAWLGVRLRPEIRQMLLGFRVLTLPGDDSGDGFATVRLVLDGVSRIVASLRRGRWDDVNAEVVPMSLDELPSVVESFDGCPIYGWEFFDLDDSSWAHWRDRLSIDVSWDSNPASPHSLRLFQEGEGPRHLDFRVWFADIGEYDNVDRIDLGDFAAGGRRWWDAMYSGDARTKAAGILPAGPLEPEQ